MLHPRMRDRETHMSSQAPYIKAIKRAHPDWSVTAYVRSTQPENELKATLQADRIAVGTFDEFEKISALSKEHDICVNIYCVSFLSYVHDLFILEYTHDFFFYDPPTVADRSIE